MGCFFPYLFISPLEGDFFHCCKIPASRGRSPAKSPPVLRSRDGPGLLRPQCWGSGWATALSGLVGAIWGSLWALCSRGCGSTKLGKGNFANKTHAMHARGLQLPLLEMHQPRAVTASACLGSKALGCGSPSRCRLPGSGAVCPVAMQPGMHPNACEDLWALQDVVSLSSVFAAALLVPVQPRPLRFLQGCMEGAAGRSCRGEAQDGRSLPPGHGPSCGRWSWFCSRSSAWCKGIFNQKFDFSCPAEPSPCPIRGPSWMAMPVARWHGHH